MLLYKKLLLMTFGTTLVFYANCAHIFRLLWRCIVYNTKLRKPWQHHLFTRQCLSEDGLFESQNAGNSIKGFTLILRYYLFVCKIEEHRNDKHLKIWDMFTP